MIKKLAPGARVSVETIEATHSGLVLPSIEKGVLMLKLDNGYNIGISESKIEAVKVLGKQKLEQFPVAELKKRRDLPTVSVITTGGTITSRVDYKTGAVRALSKPEELLASIPELAEMANLKILSPFQVMSEDMDYTHWQKLASLVAKELNDKSVCGAIVTHGTDTLHFTSAALSFMLKEPSKPVALVGGQRSSDRGSFDGAQNLICAVHYCLSDIAEVAVVMHESTEDKACLAIRGTKVRKMHTSRRDAFRPINDTSLARIFPDGKVEVLAREFRKRSDSKVLADIKFEPKVGLIRFAPGIAPALIDFYVKEKYKGIIIEGTGLGHVPVQAKKSWLPSIKRAVNAGLFVGMTSQCLYGRVDPFVYDNGRYLHDAGVVYLEDMLPEVAYVKLMWVLANYKSSDVKATMLSNLANEFSPKISEDSFLY